MSASLLFTFVALYFLILLIVAYFTSRNAGNNTFFIGNKNSNWMLVAFGMIGTSLSGVTFVSVPGSVGGDAFAYFQITIGYFIGYLAIAFVLLPLYYRLNLTSIYNYLNTRLGFHSYKTGASFFILSRTLGATARLYLVVKILQDAILSQFNIPFGVTTLIILLMILLYTYEGGVKTIVWTDTLQTTCMLAGLVICVVYILQQMNLTLATGLDAMNSAGYSKIFFTDANDKLFFVKQILAGAFITITMTGMDQEMMQKNISVKTLKDAQKNVVVLSFIMLFVILLFLFLGGLLHLYAREIGINDTGDKLFPAVALNHMPPMVSIIFIIALISALFPSADGAITALTSSFCIDILGMQRNEEWTDEKKKKIRQRVHLSFAVLFLALVMIFKWVNNPSMIGLILTIASYTYGPLLGLFSFGILTKRTLNEKMVPYICLGAPIICFALDKYQNVFFGEFHIGLELLIINGLLTFLGLLAISKKKQLEPTTV
ncbi:sodium:solute symporter [Solitalea koreensis]|uniref:Na+/proline symporter n=1 Tax=Solitalea koreensis TaxID=543615 RepID=A0A521BQH6_9SPHI|nr:sodium:solute symporter [Solitalea koreensis]SMO49424.1 Na+/proline symporter [Solitalea koreensis]